MNWLRLHVSNLCNFKCPNCHVFELGDNILPSKVMPKEIFQKAVSSFIESLRYLNQDQASIETMISIYGGETLANKKVIKECIEEFGRSYQGVNIKWILNTNGSLLKEEDVVFFKQHGVEIHLSVDGREEIHNLSRPTHKGKGTFHMVRPALEFIKKHNAPAQINSYMMPSNYMELNDLVDIASTYGIRKIYLDQFYNLEMIKHKVGVEKYRRVYLYGMQKGVDVIGPWLKVLRNHQHLIHREDVLKKSLSLDVNIDGSFYFPTFIESKDQINHIDQFFDFIKMNGHQKITQKILEKSKKYCEGCSIKDSCRGLAIEQVQYHVGLKADHKVSCDFYRDWISFLQRPIYFLSSDNLEVISVFPIDPNSKILKELEHSVKKISDHLWPLRRKARINFIQYKDELEHYAGEKALPDWVNAISRGDNVYHKGTKLTPWLLHELTHIFLFQEDVKAPYWFQEGVCEWVQNKKINDKDISESVRKINIFSTAEFEWNDKFEKPVLNPIYVQAHAFILYLENIFSREILIQIILATKDNDLSDVLEHFSGKSLSFFAEDFRHSYSARLV